MEVRHQRIRSTVFLLCFAVYAFSPLSINIRQLKPGDLFSTNSVKSLKNISLHLVDALYRGIFQKQVETADSACDKILLVKKKALLSHAENISATVCVGDIRGAYISPFMDMTILSYLYANHELGAPHTISHFISSPNSPPYIAA